MTIGSKTIEIADEIDTALQNNSEIRKVFQEAKGDTEFTTDGAFINIRNEENTHCWREVKVAIFSKRKRGASDAGRLGQAELAEANGEYGNRNAG
ncbi:hypothetical protein FACS189443_3760 [Planctomycetales bacterium]|nr:hypothetical protein FACS189443_3760 [Planctomycetales bacterium]